MDFRNCVFLITLALSNCWNFSAAGVCDLEMNDGLPFCNPSLPIDARVRDLISRIPLIEMGRLMVHNATAIPSIGLEAHQYSNEALHGIASSRGITWKPPTEFATSFPSIINLASAFNKDLFARVTKAIGDEGRAFYNVRHAYLTFWSPNINLHRDPRWGRASETPGEDPLLTSIYGELFVRGMQGTEEEQEANNGFLKSSACCKHFAAHSSETDRISHNAIVTEQDMADTYLPAFKACVEKGKASGIMCSFNAINGIPACAHKELLTHTVREKWGFDGYVTSDCGGVNTIRRALNYTNSNSELIFAVLDAGLDVECEQGFSTYPQVFSNDMVEAVNDGSVSVQLIHQALHHLFRTHMRVGMFEKDADKPYLDLDPVLIVDNDEHKQLALEAARQSIVLLKNDGGVLPLNKDLFNNGAKLALIGPHLNTSQWFLGGYHGFPSHIDTPLESILANYVADIEYELGCEITGSDSTNLQKAEDLARASTTEQIVLFVGITSNVEGEDNDRSHISLTGLQSELISRVLSVAKSPVVLVLITGGAIDLTEYKFDPRVGAILNAGYTGQAAGLAIADVLFGTYNPAGRLPHTFYASEILEQYEVGDMSMRPDATRPGRTYRFYQGRPVYEFGYGLSYTTFGYNFLNIPLRASNVEIIAPKKSGLFVKAEEDCLLVVDISVRNTGQVSGDHSVLWYLAPPEAGQMGRPLKTLVHFDRITNLQPSAQVTTSICLNVEKFELADQRGEFVLVTGRWTLIVGNLQLQLDVSNA